MGKSTHLASLLAEGVHHAEVLLGKSVKQDWTPAQNGSWSALQHKPVVQLAQLYLKQMHVYVSNARC